MSDTVQIIITVITMLGTILTVILGNRSAQKEAEHRLDKAQAVTDAKIDELTREVREHNGYARRVPVIEEQIKVINHRLADVEGEIKR